MKHEENCCSSPWDISLYGRRCISLARGNEIIFVLFSGMHWGGMSKPSIMNWHGGSVSYICSCTQTGHLARIKREARSGNEITNKNQMIQVLIMPIMSTIFSILFIVFTFGLSLFYFCLFMATYFCMIQLDLRYCLRFYCYILRYVHRS